MLLFGNACLASSLSALDFLHLGVLLPLRSLMTSGPPPSALNLSVIDSILLLQLSVCLGSAVSLFGLARVGSVFLLSMLDHARLGAVVSSRSLVQLGLSLFAPDSLSPDVPVSLHSFA
jgi:hypothetical protein